MEQNKKRTIYRIVQELLVNMTKHSNATLASINFKAIEKTITIHYVDNGKGVNIQDNIFKNGLHNIENQILNIKGEMEIDSALDQGFKATFKIPV
jgi:signal transduction histidine kinase